MSKTGWSNSSVFLEYLQRHFVRYIQRPDSSQAVLLIFDGHTSHINVPVLEWAQRNNIVLFVLPAHTSHCLQLLDVGCFGPLQKIYNNMCHKFMRDNPSSKITRFNVASLASKAYVKALSIGNLVAAFKKTGIHPLSKAAISPDNFKPSEPYIAEEEVPLSPFSPVPDSFFLAQETVTQNKKSYNMSTKKTLSSVVSGQEITRSDIALEITQSKQCSKQSAPSTASSHLTKSSKVPTTAKQSSHRLQCDPVPGPSGICIHSDSDSDTSEEMSDDDKCCVCYQFQPRELKNCLSLVITKWAQCDHPGCGHWTHLIYCCTQRVIRRNDTFICPCHASSHTEE